MPTRMSMSMGINRSGTSIISTLQNLNTENDKKEKGKGEKNLLFGPAYHLNRVVATAPPLRGTLFATTSPGLEHGTSVFQGSCIWVGTLLVPPPAYPNG